jgi:hypothetical protein
MKSVDADVELTEGSGHKDEDADASG